MSDVVLDASAVLAYINSETGAEMVATHLPRAFMSAVNHAEVGSRLSDLGMPDEIREQVIAKLGVRIVPFDESSAHDVAVLRRATRGAGLSLGDRACLALTRALKVPALTADRDWAALTLGVEIRLIR